MKMSDAPSYFLVWSLQTHFKITDKFLLSDFSENVVSGHSVLRFKH